MEETRVQKWKTYRESLIKQEAPIEDNKNNILDIKVKDSRDLRQTISATSTLPIEEVIKGMQDGEEQEKKSKLPLILSILAIILFGAAIIVGLVFLGIWAFGG